MSALKLHDQWLMLLKRSWSVRLMALSAVLSGLGTALTIAQPYLGISPLLIAGFIGAITMLSSLLGIYARVVKQQGID